MWNQDRLTTSPGYEAAATAKTTTSWTQPAPAPRRAPAPGGSTWVMEEIHGKSIGHVFLSLDISYQWIDIDHWSIWSISIHWFSYHELILTSLVAKYPYTSIPNTWHSAKEGNCPNIRQQTKIKLRSFACQKNCNIMYIYIYIYMHTYILYV